MDTVRQGQFAQLAPDTDNEFNFNTSNQDGLQQLINLQQQQLDGSEHQKSQILELQQQQHLQDLELQESKLQILQLQRQISELQQHLEQHVQESNLQSLMLPHENGGEIMVLQNHSS